MQAVREGTPPLDLYRLLGLCADERPFMVTILLA